MAKSGAEKRKFLVAYDYGMGGSWLFIYAHSSEEIKSRYPMLNIVESTPEWMTPYIRRQIEETDTYDVNQPPTGFLLALLKELGYEKPD